MKAYTNIILVTGFAILISGCISTTVTPEGNRSFTVMASAQTKAVAYNSVAAKAVAICGRESRLEVICRDIKYQGLDVEQVELIQDANAVFPQTEPKEYFPRDLIYTAYLTFRCK